MDLEIVFKAVNTIALLGWILLIASRWVKALRPMVYGAIVPVLLGIAYVVMIIVGMPKAEGGFDSLSGVMALFQDPRMVLAGWLHYLAFDLLIGTWIWANAEQNRVPWFAALPALFFAFMLGPAGFLLYLVIRAAVTKSVNPQFASSTS
ncbi:MAG: ABA4-like family protein [Verrucomicrobiota bacterium]